MRSASTDTLEALWLSLPEELRARLRLGYSGKQHLLDVAGWCLRSGSPRLIPLATDALLTAFGENPLDGEMASELLRHDAIQAMLPPASTTALAALAKGWRKPDNTGYFERLVLRRDMDKLKEYLTKCIANEPENLFWRQQALAFGLIDNDPDWVSALPPVETSDTLAPVLNCVAAMVHAFRGDHDKAARAYQDLGAVFGHSFASGRAGLAVLAAGDRASANLLLTDGLAGAPWNVSLILRLHDLVLGLDSEARPTPGSTAVLIYTWNKDVEVDATLRSLFESDLTGASVFVLDNGSTDTTPAVLDSWRSRFTSLLGKDRFETITLPVNIGAPPARNWLMHHPPVAAHDFICYLDDDVVLPRDWLLRLGAAVQHYPEAGVWGCKVVDHTNPALIQSADSHLLIDPDGPPTDLSRPAPNPFKLSDLHIQTMDNGQFDCLRPCASVTGCCHLFRTETLLESGDFAIHLSPTQYDDMEHDLRLCEAGKFPVYQGHLAVRHKKRTGAASRVSMQEEGNALGNKYKMQTMHDRADLIHAMKQEQAVLEEDLLKKIRVLDGA